MAEKKSSLGFRLLAGDKEAKRKVSPKRPSAQKPEDRVTVRQTYGLVFDPSGRQSQILSEEQKAARDLYLRRVGEAAREDADPRSLLESAGWLKPTVSKREAASLRRGASDEFASAMDALDYLNRAAGKAIVPAAKTLLGVAQPYTLLGTTETGRRIAGALPDVPVQLPGLRKTTTVGEAVSGIGEGVAEVARPLGQIREEMQAPPGSISAGGARGAGAPTTAGLKQTRPLQDIVFGKLGEIQVPIPDPRSAASLQTSQPFLSAAPPVKQKSLKEIQDWSQEAASKPNKYIDASSEDKTIMPGASKPLVGAIEMTLDGASPDENQTYLEQAQFDGLSPNEDEYLRKKALREGHDVGRWDSLLPGEKIAMAYTSSDYWLVTMRNAFRAVAAMGATPAAVKAIGDAGFGALRGDTEEGARLIEGIIAPYAYAKQVAERDGLAAGLAVAFRENPVDVALSVNAAVRTVGRVGGIVARTGRLGARAQEFARPYRPVTIQPGEVTEKVWEPLLPGPFRYEPGQGSPVDQYNRWQARTREMQDANSERIAEALRVNNVNAAGVPVAITRRQLSQPVVIGYTTPNLTSGVSLSLKRRLAKLSLKASKSDIVRGGGVSGRKARLKRAESILGWYSTRMLRNQGYNFERTQSNVFDGFLVEVERELTKELGRRPTELEKARAAWDLSRSLINYENKANTPANEAAYFRGEIEKLKNDPEYAGNEDSPEFVQSIARWESAANDLDLIDSVTIDPEVSARLRDVARAYGEKNNELIAKALGITVDEAKRANYLRLLVIDPDFESAALALKAAKNAKKPEFNALVKAQKRIAALSREIQKKVSTAGYGKKGARKSAARFAALRNELVAELRNAERAALQLGDEALANQYRDLRAPLTLARASAPERAAAIAEQVAAIGRLEAQAEDLPIQARGAYRSAQEAMRVENAAERESIAATTAAREAAAAVGLRRVDANAISAAENALAEARRAYDLDRESTMLSPDQIEASRVAVVQAEERLAALRSAQEAGAAGVAARETLREAIGRRETYARQAQRIVEKNAPVLDSELVRVALDAAQEVAGIRVRRKKDYGFYNLQRAREETLDEFIARAEAADKHAILHLVQKGDFTRVGSDDGWQVYDGTRIIDVTPKGKIRSGRFKESRGHLFAIGGEDFASAWKNLMFDTAELGAAEGWQKKMNQFIVSVSVRVSVSDAVMRAAVRRADERKASLDASGDPYSYDDLLRSEVMNQLQKASFTFNALDWALVNTVSPRARGPRNKVPIGNVNPSETTADFMLRELNNRNIDPSAPNDYYLMPKAVYDGIQDAMKDEAFRFKYSKSPISGYQLDRMMRAWRTFTLNVLPRTAFANIAGSAILALQGGAGPRSWYMAWRALTGRVDPNTGRPYPIPKELLQRYYDQFTPEIGGGGRAIERPTSVQGAAAFAAWWMNGIRRLNGMSEDFGRLAVWYSKAYPEALAAESRGVPGFLSRAKRLNDDAVDLLESMANNDPQWAAKNAAWIQQSYDFLGYLHRGGQAASRARIFFPFWQWYMHMLKLTFLTMPVKYPGRALFLQQLGEIGDEYQRTHGVIIPYGEELIPLWSFAVDVDGKPQWVTTTIDSSTWYPEASASGIASREGRLSPLGYLRGATNPIVSNSMLSAATVGSLFAGGPALEFSDQALVRAARDEYGNDLGFDMNYFANRLGQMIPMSPIFMSLAGRPANSTLWNLEEKPPKGPQVDRMRTDVVSTAQAIWDRDKWQGNLLRLGLKVLIGSNFTNVPGLGPVERDRLRRTYEYMDRQERRKERNIAQKLEEIHSPVRIYSPDRSESGVLGQSRPGGTEQ